MAVAPNGRSLLGPALTLIGVGALVLGVVDVVLALAGGAGAGWPSALFTLVGWVYATAGAVAWSRRPSNRLGLVMIVGGFSLLAANLANSGDAILIALGTIIATLPFALVVHLLHAFPSGRLTGAGSRVVVAAGYVVCVLLQAPLYLFRVPPAPSDLLGVVDRPELASAGAAVQTAAGTAVLLATAVILADRLRRGTSAQRRVLAPLYGYGLLAVPLIPLLANVVGPLTGLAPDTVGILQRPGCAVRRGGRLRGGGAAAGGGVAPR